MTIKKRGNPNLRKGVQPEHLKGKDFKAHPERINKYGAPTDAITLRRMIQAMGNEEIQLLIKKGNSEESVTMTRFERILFEWFTTANSRKQEMLMAYAFGKPVETLEVKGELKVIKVTLKKKEEGNNEPETNSQDK